MDRKAIWIIGLFLLALPIAYAATCSFYESAGYLDMAAESSEILNVSETDYCYCSSCVECTNALNNPNCTYVQLVSDIINYSTTCINNPAGFVNKTFDCAGNEISGAAGSWFGIHLTSKTGNTIKDCNIKRFPYGIYLASSSNNFIDNAAADSNAYGIYLYNSPGNTINNSLVTSSSGYGLYLYSSPNTMMRNNRLDNNDHNFVLSWGNYLPDFYQDIDDTNTVDGKPIFYWIAGKNAPNGCRDYEIDGTSNAGFVALVSCDNVTVRGLNLSRNGNGILLANTSNSKILNNSLSFHDSGAIHLFHSPDNSITNNKLSFNYDGMLVRYSNNTLVKDNIISPNDDWGIYFEHSDNNRIIGNKLGSSGWAGLDFDYSNNNLIHDNDVSNSYYGLYFSRSINNNISNTLADYNDGGGIYMRYSGDSILINNTANSNGWTGFEISDSYSIVMINNSALSNYWDGFYIDDSTNNVVIGNDASENGWLGFEIYRGSGHRIENNIANLNNWTGIDMHGTSNNNVTWNTANLNVWSGISIYSSDNILARDNIANDNEAHGIQLSRSTNVKAVNNTAKENWLYDISFSVGAEGDCSSNILTDNIGSGGREIKYFNSPVNLNDEIISELILCNADNSNIDNVTVDGSESLQNNGIVVYYTSGTDFINIQSSDNNRGIYIERSSSNNISQNMFDNNNYGINMRSYSNSNTIQANSMSNNTNYGFYMYHSDFNTIQANSMSNNTNYGFYIYYSDSNTIKDNEVNYNNKGITIAYSANNNVFSNNKANNNQRNGLYFSSTAATGNIVNSNEFCSNNQSAGNYYDVYDKDSNSGDGNTCNTTNNWNDIGTTGCSYLCAAPEVPETVLTISKSSRPYAYVGDNIIYNITLQNTGTSSAYNITVTDTLPAGFVFTGASHNYSVNGSGIVWEFDELQGSNSINISLAANVTSAAAFDSYNFIEVLYYDSEGDSDLADNHSSINVYNWDIMDPVEVLSLEALETPLLAGRPEPFNVTLRNNKFEPVIARTFLRSYYWGYQWDNPAGDVRDRSSDYYFEIPARSNIIVTLNITFADDGGRENLACHVYENGTNVWHTRTMALSGDLNVIDPVQVTGILSLEKPLITGRPEPFNVTLKNNRDETVVSKVFLRSYYWGYQWNNPTGDVKDRSADYFVEIPPLSNVTLTLNITFADDRDRANLAAHAYENSTNNWHTKTIALSGDLDVLDPVQVTAINALSVPLITGKPETFNVTIKNNRNEPVVTRSFIRSYYWGFDRNNPNTYYEKSADQYVEIPALGNVTLTMDITFGDDSSRERLAAHAFENETGKYHSKELILSGELNVVDPVQVIGINALDKPLITGRPEVFNVTLRNNRDEPVVTRSFIRSYYWGFDWNNPNAYYEKSADQYVEIPASGNVTLTMDITFGDDSSRARLAVHAFENETGKYHSYSIMLSGDNQVLDPVETRSLIINEPPILTGHNESYTVAFFNNRDETVMTRAFLKTSYWGFDDGNPNAYYDRTADMFFEIPALTEINKTFYLVMPSKDSRARLVAFSYENISGKSDYYPIGITVYGAPTISNIAHTSVNFENETMVNISAAVTDDLGLAEVLLFHDISGEFVNQTMEHEGNLYYSMLTIGLDSPDFNYYIHAKDTDNFITASTVRTFETDRTPPEIILASPIGNVFTKSKELKFIAEDTIDSILTCNISIDGIIEVSNLDVNSGQQKTVTASTLTEGQHSWFVKCWDDNDNTAISDEASFRYDGTGPTVTLISPPQDAELYIDEVDFSFSVTDNFDDSLECSLLLNGETKGQAIAANDSSVQLTASNLAGNTYDWLVKCYDDAGNFNTIPVRALSIITDIEISNIIILPAEPLEGSTIEVDFTLDNLGDVDANVRVQSLVDDVEKNINNFNIEKQSTGDYSLSISLEGAAPGERNITLRVPKGPLVDSDTSNNEISRIITVMVDETAPEIIDYWTVPEDITEHSQDVSFNIDTIDTGVGVGLVTLYYKTSSAYDSVNLSRIGNKYTAALPASLFDPDAEQGKDLAYYFVVSDNNNNTDQTEENIDYIEIIDDVPIVDITEPGEGDVWAGTNSILWSCDNDDEGPCYNDAYYWDAYYFAPAYPDPEFFVQGEYILIGSTNDSSVDWDTSDFNGISKIKIATTDGTHSIDTLSEPFAVNNEPPGLTIDNYIASYIVAPAAKIYGTVRSDFSTISSLTINDTNFVLTVSPVGWMSGNYEFSAIDNVSGSFFVTIIVTDEQNNPHITSAEFIVDDQPPVISDMCFIGMAYTGAHVVFNADVTDNYAIKEVLAALSNTTEMVYDPDNNLYSLDMEMPNIPGNYTIYAAAEDQVGLRAEERVIVEVVQGPDLIISEINITPEIVNTGEIAYINATIENIGGLNADNVLVNAYIGEELIGSDIINVTDAAIAEIQFDTTGHAGNQTINVKIEESTDYYESDYTNNEAQTGYFIDAPDFAVNVISFYPDECFAGQTVAIMAEIGSEKEIPGEVRVDFYIDEVNESKLIGYKFVDFAGIENKIVNQDWITAGYEGEQTIIVVVNPDSLPAEIFSGNNMLDADYYITTYFVENIPDTLDFDKVELSGLAGEKIRGITSGNFNDDNRIDFAAGTESGKIVVFRNINTTYSYYDIRKNISFEKEIIDDIGQPAFAMTSGDFYGDSFNDIIVGTESGDVLLYNNTNAVFDKTILFNAGEKAYGITSGDFDNDGDLDIIVGNLPGHVSLYLNNDMDFVFDRFMTTREEPFGMTTGDYNLDGRLDLIVGDRLGQIERVVYENGKYRNHLFADIGAFAHGLSTADIDFNGRLDLMAIGFDGRLNLFYSREGGLVLDPLVIEDFGGDSFAITSGDYDQDIDIDIIVAGDNGQIYLLFNTIQIRKQAEPFPVPTSRSFEVIADVNNPWAKEITGVDVLEEWIQDDVYFIEDNYTICTCCFEIMGVCTDLRCRTGDMKFFDDDKMYLLDLPNTVYYDPEFTYDYDACFEWQTHDYDGGITAAEKSIDITNLPRIFEKHTIIQKETFSYRYKLMLGTDEDVVTTTRIDYEILGDMLTPDSDYILSDDVNNIPDSNPNIRNLGGSEFRTDKDDFTILVVPPDFEPYDIEFEYKEPPGNLGACLDFAEAISGGCIEAILQTESEKFTEITAWIKNNNNIAIEDVGAAFYYGDEYIDTCLFNISQHGISQAKVMWKAIYNGSNVIKVKVNPGLDVIETDYTNNEYSVEIYPNDLSIEKIEFYPENPKEGQSFVISTTLTNFGNESIKEALYYYGLKEKPSCEEWLFEDEAINCSLDSPDYDEEMCDGYFFSIEEYLQGKQPGFVVVPRIVDYENIGPGETRIINRTITAGDQTIRSQGQYDFSIVVGNSPAADMDLSNNALSAELNVLPSQADLRDDYSFILGCTRTAHGITFQNPEDNIIRVSFGNKNNGGEDADNYKIRVYYDNDESSLMHTFEDAITINHTSKQFSFTYDWSAMEERDYPVTFELDYEDVINESNENNNVVDGLFRWKELNAKQLWFSIDEPRPGDMITIFAKIENIGHIRTGDFNVGLYIDDVLVDEITTSLFARENKIISIPYIVPEGSERSYDVKLILDYDDSITEHNEGNNIIEKTLYIFPELDWEINLLSRNYGINKLKSYVYENGSWIDAELGIEEFSMEYGSSPLFVEFDGDMQPELIVGSLDGKLMLYNYTVESGEWNETLLNIDVGARSVPSSVDLDDDGIIELVVGNAHGMLSIFNSSDFAELEWDIFNITRARNIAPAFADLDDDNDYDLVIGDSTGSLAYYENIGNAAVPYFVPGNLSMPELNDPDSAPSFYDLDGDGDDDLFVGTASSILYFENIGGVFSENDINLPVPEGENAKIGLMGADDGLYLVVGSDSPDVMGLRKTYTEPIGVQIINYAGRDFTYAVKLEYRNLSTGKKITDIMSDTPFEVMASGAVEKVYDIDIPPDIPDDIALVAVSEVKSWVRKEWLEQPELGGYTTYLEPKGDALYEIDKPHRIYINGTMSGWEYCKGFCQLKNLQEGVQNKIVISGSSAKIYEYQKLSASNYRTVKLMIPAVTLNLKNAIEFGLKEGYIEDVEFVINNNNRRDYDVDRIVLQLFDWDNYRFYDLYTDTDGFTLPEGGRAERSYKVFVPYGLPKNSTFMIKVITKQGMPDDIWYRNNVDEWPENDLNSNYAVDGAYYEENLPAELVLDNELTDEDNWGWQRFSESHAAYLRKHFWASASIYKAEYNEYAGPQICFFGVVPLEEVPHLTSWVNGEYKESLDADAFCKGVKELKWRPFFNDLELSSDNSITVFQHSSNSFAANIYKVINLEMKPYPFIDAEPAFKVQLSSLGVEGLLRRGYEENVNITIENNDDDNITVNVVSFDLVGPDEEIIHLLTDTAIVILPPESIQARSYSLVIPTDVPLGSELRVQVERIYEFPDRLWLRNSAAGEEELLSEDTFDFGWGDTLPTPVSSNYRKHVFAPLDVTRMEMVLGGSPSTKAYLNGEYQGMGYTGWSPVAVDSGLKEGQDNIISVIGSLPNTESRIYSGDEFSDGNVIDVEQEVFYTVFGVKEQAFVPGRENFYVYPGENITARIKLENYYNTLRDFTLSLSVVDFENNDEIILHTQDVQVGPLASEYLEIDLIIPETVSYDTKLQLSNIWNEQIMDKNWLRASNVDDDVANNRFLDDSSWGVVELSNKNENAKYFRKHQWIDSHTQGVLLDLDNVEKLWVNGIPVDISYYNNGWMLLRDNEATKSDDNLFTIKAEQYDVDAEIMLEHFVPVRTTDLEIFDASHSSIRILEQGPTYCYDDQSLCNCSDESIECTYVIKKEDSVEFNFSLRNTGELFAGDFILSAYARNLDTNEITEFARENLTMHPFSDDLEWRAVFDSEYLAGSYEFAILADSEDIIIESSEFNNEYKINVFVNSVPEIKYIDAPVLAGYNENIEIESMIIDESLNLENVSSALDGFEISLIKAGDIYSHTYYGDQPSGHKIYISAEDSLGEEMSAESEFDTYSSIYLNVKTEKDIYYYGEAVSLTEKDELGLEKEKENNAPVAYAFDNAEIIKGGSVVEINTYAFDPDGDLITLDVCRDINCIEHYCSETANTDPKCSFDAEKDNDLHHWYAYVKDKEGLSGSVIIGDYITDSTVPETEVYSFASNQDFADTQDDGKTIVTVQGNENIKCRWALDPGYILHKDRSYAFLDNECESSREFAACNLGWFDPETIPKDELTNLSKLHISCTDEYGNEQTSRQNLDIDFYIKFSGGIYDDYEGKILESGSTVTIYGDTHYCVDESGDCMPSLEINDGAVTFNEAGIWHLRYDTESSIMDTTVLVNSLFTIGTEFTDHIGEHAFDVIAGINDPDMGSDYECVLYNDNDTIEMELEDRMAKATIYGEPLETVYMIIECSDDFDSVQVSETHAIPNTAPILRYVPDISLKQNENKSLSLLPLAFDPEQDNAAYDIVSISSSIISAVIDGDNLVVESSESLGTAELCIMAADAEEGESACINVIVQDHTKSKLLNDEFMQTAFDMLMKVQFNDSGSMVDVFEEKMLLSVEPGEVNAIGLADVFSPWNSIDSPYTAGEFRVIFMAIDNENNTLLNRDGTPITSSYSFILTHENTAPEISEIPEQGLFANHNLQNNINLIDYTNDNEQNIFGLNYSIVNQSNPNAVNCFIVDGYYVDCTASGSGGSSIVSVAAFDSYLYGYSKFEVIVYPLELQLIENLSYSFSAPIDENGTWQTQTGDAGTYVIIITETGVNHSSSTNITLTVLESLNMAPVLEHIENINVNESGLIIITANAADPDGGNLAYSINDTRFNQSNNTFTWQTTYDDSGIYDVEVTVTDSNLTDSQIITIRVYNVNRVPDITKLYPLHSDTLYENETLLVIYNGTDPDNENSVDNDDDNLTWIFDPPLDSFGDWKPEFNESGNYTLRITLSDGSLNDTKYLNVTVLNKNRPPILSPIANIIENEQELVTIIAQGTDPDNENNVENDDNILSYSIDDTRFDQSNSTFTWQTQAGDAGIYIVAVTVFDGNLTDAQNVTIRVMGVNVSCYQDSDCGIDGFMGDAYCIDKNATQDYIIFTCNDAGTVESYCSNITTSILIEECTDVCFNGSCVECGKNEDCDDGTYCNGIERCVDNVCQAGEVVDCSGNDTLIETCFYDPDNIDYTYDYYSFISVCDEDNDECTSAPLSWEDDISHSCDKAQCFAECEDENDCTANNCSEEYFDYCDGNKLVEYDDDKVNDSTTVEDYCENSCLDDCTCTDCDVNCSAPDINEYCVKDICGAECALDIDCDDSDPETIDSCNLGCVCEHEATGECSIDADCDDGLYCNGDEYCDVDGYCQDGEPIDCSGNELLINTCYYNPDNINYTFDYYFFYSVCDEDNDKCSQTPFGWESDITHECDIAQCGADCSIDADCSCPDDYCDGSTLVDYPEQGICSASCECGESCEPTLVENSPECEPGSCVGADYEYDVDMWVVGENCHGSKHYNDTAAIDVPLKAAYLVKGEVHRGSIRHCQANEDFYIEIDGQIGPETEDDIDPCAISVRIDEFGEFNLTSGMNDVIMHTAAACPPDNSANSVDLKKICLYRIGECGDGVLDYGEECESDYDCDDGDLRTNDICSQCVCEHEIVNECSIDEDCDDGLYCNGEEYCDAQGYCQSGQDVDCSGNERLVNTCYYDPDNIDYTYDYYSFISACDEELDACTELPLDWETNITHTCNKAQCFAECEDENDCEANSCSETYYDYCDGNKLVEYNDDKVNDSTTVEDTCDNSCLDDCTCTDCGVSCEAPATNEYCVKDICRAECALDMDCDDSDSKTIDSCNMGCVCKYEAANECLVDEDCDDGLYCNGDEYCDVDGYCQDGEPIDCSGNELLINTCYYNPDNINYTFDYYFFYSVCDEDNDKCSQTPFGWESDITHECDIAQCGADCSIDADCSCPDDYCDGSTLVDYPEQGICSASCECGESCEPTLVENSPECEPGSCVGADYEYDVDMWVVGENCHGSKHYNDTAAIDVPLKAAYLVKGEVHRGSIRHCQANEDFYIEIDGQIGPETEDDIDPCAISVRIDEFGEFNLTSGMNDVIMHTAAACPPDSSANSVDLKKICLYIIE